MNIRESLKQKFNNWVDERCDKGENTYNQTLDECPDDKYDWRDMLIEELLDGLQYEEKEIKIQKKEIARLNKLLEERNAAIQRLTLQIKPQKPKYADLDD